MEREKMIEEIARLICENEKPCYACLKCTIYDGKICCKYLRIAEKIVNLIIHEGTVVLTKDELADTQARMAYLQEELGKLLNGDNISVSAREYGKLLYANENVSKETAKEFAQELIKHFEEQKKRYDMCIDQRRKDLLKLSENEQELREYTIRCEGKENGQWVAADKSVEYINKLLKEKYGVEVEE